MVLREISEDMGYSKTWSDGLQKVFATDFNLRPYTIADLEKQNIQVIKRSTTRSSGSALANAEL